VGRPQPPKTAWKALIPGSGQIKMHPFLAAPGMRCQWLAVIITDEADPFIKADGGVIAVEHPQKDGPHSGAPQ